MTRFIRNTSKYPVTVNGIFLESGQEIVSSEITSEQADLISRSYLHERREEVVEPVEGVVPGVIVQEKVEKPQVGSKRAELKRKTTRLKGTITPKRGEK